MEVTSELLGNVHVVQVHGELDASNVNDFKDIVLPILSVPVKLLIDLSDTSFIDSSGMGAMMVCQRTAVASGGKVKLCCLPKQVRSAFELIRLHLVLDINETRGEALNKFQKIE